MNMSTVRGAFTDEILKLAKEDKTLYAIATDSRGSVTLTDFANTLPGQFVECGIAEQDAVGIGAGLANAGLRPFVCGPACFYSMRSAEQVKADSAASDFKKAVECIINTKRASTSHFQRQMGWGYNHAAKILDMLTEKGIVSPQSGMGPRQIIMDQDQLVAILNGGEAEASEPEAEGQDIQDDSNTPQETET